MRPSARTHYDVLGIEPDADASEVELAYNRRVAGRGREDTPPDAEDDVRLREARDVLSDRRRRADYDAALEVAHAKPPAKIPVIPLAAGTLAVAGIAIYFLFRSPAEVPGKSAREILDAASLAVGRVHVVDMNGTQQATGVAFAVAPGVLATSCAGWGPNVSLTFHLAPRVLPARIASRDEAHGTCRLEVVGGGSWPLAMGGALPKKGDRVYAASLAANGEVALKLAKVTGVDGTTIAISEPLPERHSGAPLLDSQGRVVALVVGGSYVAFSGK